MQPFLGAQKELLTGNEEGLRRENAAGLPECLRLGGACTMRAHAWTALSQAVEKRIFRRQAEYQGIKPY